MRFAYYQFHPIQPFAAPQGHQFRRWRLHQHRLHHAFKKMQELFGMRAVRAKRYVAACAIPYVRRHQDSQVQGRAFAHARTNADCHHVRT